MNSTFLNIINNEKSTERDLRDNTGVRCLPCTQLAWIQSLAPYMASGAPTRVIPKCTARNKP